MRSGAGLSDEEEPPRPQASYAQLTEALRVYNLSRPPPPEKILQVHKLLLG